MTQARPEIASVSGTAFVTAGFRMWGQAGNPPLYDDPVTGLLLDEEALAAARAAAQKFPHAPDMIRLRTRYFDDAVRQAIAGGIGQVVILGAGLDTRAARIGGEGVRYFEIDNPATLAYKEHVLAENGLLPHVCYIPGDYVEERVAPLLMASGFHAERPAFFLWEGNSTYLTENTVQDVLAQVSRCAAGVSVAMDFMHRKVIERTTGYSDLNGYIDHLARMGAPWVSGFDDITPVADAGGLRVHDQYTAAQLAARYQPHVPLHSPLFDFYSVCTLARIPPV